MTAKCYDCSLPYADEGWEDFIIPHYLWDKISPTGDSGGLLCVTCMVRRLNQKGIRGVAGAFLSGPIDTVSRHLMETLLTAENSWKRIQDGRT
jgi:hypothetical protein